MHKDTKKKLAQKVYAVLIAEKDADKAAKRIVEMMEVYELERSSELNHLRQKLSGPQDDLYAPCQPIAKTMKGRGNMNKRFRGKTPAWKNGYVEGQRDIFESLRMLGLAGIINIVKPYMADRNKIKKHKN